MRHEIRGTAAVDSIRPRRLRHEVPESGSQWSAKHTTVCVIKTGEPSAESTSQQFWSLRNDRRTIPGTVQRCPNRTKQAIGKVKRQFQTPSWLVPLILMICVTSMAESKPTYKQKQTHENTGMPLTARSNKIKKSFVHPLEECHNEMVHRQKRSVTSLDRDHYIFVARRDQEGDLFTLSTDEMERFAFDDTPPENLALDSETGMVSCVENWDISVEQVNFNVNITRTDNSTYEEQQEVTVHLVSRGTYDPILTTEPRPLHAVVPMWIRPDTTILRVSAIDADMFAAKVHYNIESGANERFTIDAETGDIKIAGREPFELGEEYELAISANIPGSAPTTTTHAQVVKVVTADLPPQFYSERYEVKMDEFTAPGSQVETSNALSFFDLPVTYTLTPAIPGDTQYFSINEVTGDISPTQELKFVSDPRQYRMIVTANEGVTTNSSTAELIIDLVDINNHEPYFPLVVYESEDIQENAAVNTNVLQLSIVDLDDGVNGQVTFYTDDYHFAVDPNADMKSGNLIINSTLDYDSLTEKYYEFRVFAEDGGSPPLTGFTTVRVWVENVNTKAPVFLPDVQRVYVKENLVANGGNLLVHVIQAYDPDGDGIEFTVEDQTPYFRIESNGNVYLNQDLVDGMDAITVVVTATDDDTCCTDSTGPHQSNGTVIFDFIGVNRPPRFPGCGNYNPTLYENQGSGAPVQNVTAVDTDPGSNGILVYSIVRPESGQPFFGVRMIDDTAEVYALRDFDRENPVPFRYMKVNGKITYPVTVQVEDEGIPKMYATCFFLVIIGDENDNAPEFDINNYQKNIHETLSAGETMYRVFAHDFDEGINAEVSYEIESEDPENSCGGSPCFNIDGDSGVITARSAATLTVSQITVNVKARDEGEPPQESVVRPVILAIEEDESLLPPEWQDFNGMPIDQITITIVETFEGPLNPPFTALPASGCLSVRYSMPSISWEFMNANDDFSFLQTADIQIMAVKPLDYTRVDIYVLLLRATCLEDNSPSAPRSDVRVRVNLIDENTKTPSFQGTSSTGGYPASIADDSEVGTLVTMVFAVDLDGTSPHNAVRYYWPDDCGQDCDAFNINDLTGAITSNREFDREVQDTYDINVVARDMDGQVTPESNNATHRLVIQITGGSTASPYFTDISYSAILDEGPAFGTTVLQVEAENPDEQLNVPQYDLVGGNTDRMFAVDRETGRIYTAGWVRYGNSGEYNLVLRVFDGQTENTTNVDISINRQNLFPPRFSPLEYTSNNILELDGNLVDNPATVALVTATDPDPDIVVRYSLDGKYVVEDRERFNVLGNGEVHLQRPLDRDYPNGHSNWQINAVADDGDKSGYGIINIHLIDINDNAPIFDPVCLDGEVPENSGTGTSVVQLTAMDYDEGPNSDVKYRILESPDDGAGNPIFAIPDEDTGWITVSQPVLDREAQDEYVVQVEAEDQAVDPDDRLTTTQTIWIKVLDENDHEPEFPVTSYALTMDEMLPIGTSVGEVLAEDADLEYNAQRTYTVQPGPDSQYFYMDSIYVAGTGVIKIQEVVDYEALPPNDKTLTFTVRVVDPDPTHVDTATVTFTVSDVNDNPPIFTPDFQNVNVSEAAEVGDAVTSFTATDPDTGINAEFDYSIDYEQTDPLKNFQIDPDNGAVTIRNQLDRETVAVHEVHILAIDKGAPPQTGTATLLVFVEDINDNPPRFREDYAPWVYDDTPLGTTVVDIMAEDPDEPQNGPPFFLDANCDDVLPSPEECRAGLSFEYIEDQTGNGDDILRVTTLQPDGYTRERLGFDNYIVPVHMSNRYGTGDPSQTSTGTLTVWIESTNANEHSAAQKNVQVYNYRRQFENASLGHVNVEDPDDGDRHEKTFSMNPDDPESEFFRVEEFGELYMERGTPPGRHILTVSVTDDNWSRSRTVDSVVIVDIMYIEDYHLKNSGSMRLTGMTAEEFIYREKIGEALGDYAESKLNIFQRKMAEILATEQGNVDVFSVRDVPGEDHTIDIHYKAHGSPDYLSSRLNGLAWANKEDIGLDLEATVVMAPLDFCMEETCWDSGCHNNLVTTSEPLLVNTNATSLVGVTAFYEISCKCAALDFSGIPTTGAIKCQPDSCLNNGTCHETWSDYYCECPEGFEGPRCQQLKHSFSGNGWAWYPPLEQCEDASTSFQFMTTNQNGMLLYNGPMYDPATTHEVLDFISVELVAGYPRLLINLGEGTLELTIDGRDAAGDVKLDPLNDGVWHTIEIFKKHQTINMVVDHCQVSAIIENIDTSEEDRTACEAVGSLEGEHFLLNVYTPLQLGGRSSTVYPPDVSSPGFTGCISNLRHNGILYDLHIGEVGEQQGAADGCEADRCDSEGFVCPGNSTCVGSISGTPRCVCLPGYMGEGSCDTETTVKDFPADDSFIEWNFRDEYNQTQNNPRANTLQLMFRTRDPNGFLFQATSFSTLERMIVELVDGHPSLRYDMGAGDVIVALLHVVASDGIWHVLTIHRYGNQVIMKMDGGEGRYYAESWPQDAHRLIALYGRWTAVAANVYYKKYHDDPFVEDGLEDTCMNDVRFQETLWFPMTEEENNDFALIQAEAGTELGCSDWDSCASITCPAPQFCEDVWRLGICVCPANMTNDPDNNDMCILVNDCDIYNPCENGHCVIDQDGNWVCRCFEGWGGEFCESGGGTTSPRVDSFASLSDAAMIIIIMCIFLVLILMLIFIAFSNKKKKDLLLEDPYDDLRENVVFYEEEGAGEEDETGYDIVPLRKPVDDDSLEKLPIDPYGAPDEPLRREIPVTTAAEPMMAQRRPYNLGPNGEKPDIGDFVNDHLNDADNDPNAPPYDSIREYAYEGSGSIASSLSSLQSNSSGDQDYDYLNDWGPRFQKLADMYGVEDDNASNV